MEPSPRPTHPLSAFARGKSWAAPAGASGSLPVFLTSFVGRQDELALASSLLQRPDLRLLTLTGPGGTGKTRLATEIAVAVSAQFRDGVRFVSLVSVQDSAMVMATVAVALGLREFDDASVDDIVASSLGGSNLLLVVDNLEHVMAAAPALTSLLARCPRLKMLVTSRSLLRVEGEHALPVPPLALPGTTARLTRDEWLRVPAIRLFIERAAAVDPSLPWDLAGIHRLAEICGRLDGLPLAIELAATRMRHFTLEEINTRLNDMLPLLVDGSRDHPSRLQTMRNAVAWSYDLLSPGAQALLRHASAFSGGFKLDAIATVSRSVRTPQPDADTEANGGRPTDAASPPTIENLLSTLIDASLLIREPGPVAGTARYRMLETIREFALEQLEADGEEELARRAHAAWFTDYAVLHEIVELIPEHVQSMDQLVAEQANLRSALAWLLEVSDGERLGRLVAALGRFWLAQSNYQEGRTWFERALAAQPAATDAARILVSLGMAEIFLGENEAAETHLVRGKMACQEYGEAHRVALALVGLAGLAVARGDSEKSTQLLEECRHVLTAIPDARLAGVMAGWVSINLAVAARMTGNGELAERHIEEALDRFRAERFNIGMMMALGDLGDLARDRGNWTRALSLYMEALAVDRTDQAKRIVIEIIESVATVAAHANHPERSAVLLGAAEGLRDRLGLRYRPPRNRSSLERTIEATRLGLSTETYAAAWQIGRDLPEDEAIAAARDVNDSTVPPVKFALTARESEILRLLATGLTDPEIADRLYISVRTVEHHVASIYRKLDVRTRSAATSTAIAAGLVAAGDSG